ncbi:MAG: T9SS type A sorting domain-containing protein [Candidatus Zixiibacteriota bacterium]|nr:MAG: T9SS type A sorting domain-containing protein [candidate division Zixibacteria bacterium]
MLIAKSIYNCLLLLLLSAFIGLSICSAADQTSRLERHKSRIFVPHPGVLTDFQLRPLSPKLSDFEDIRVSESATPATFIQKRASIAFLEGGKYIVVWQDRRFGSFKIVAQTYDANGNVLSGNTLLVGRDDGYDLIEPKAVTDGSGGFYLAWRDVALGRIYAARYSNTLAGIVEPFIVNDVPFASYAGPFDIDSYGNNRLAVVWEDYNSGNDIALRIFDSLGTPIIDSPIRVNTDTGEVQRWVPSVAFDNTGRIGIAWEDYKKGNADILFQLLNTDGTLSGSNLGIVENAFDDSAQYLPRIAYSFRDGFAIGWLDRRSGMQEVYLQRFVPGTGLIGGNMMISEADTLTQNWDIDMDVNSLGNLYLAWASIDESDQILLQAFSEDFTPTGATKNVNRFMSGSRWETAVRIGASDRLMGAWTDFRAGNGDIYMQLLTSAGNPLLAEDRLVNNDASGAESIAPDIAIIDDSKSAVVFTDARNDAGDIFVQLVNNDGNLIASNRKVNSDSVEALQNEPAIAASASKALIVWNDSRSVLGITGQRIFSRYVLPDGIFGGADFVVSDSDNVSSKRLPAVAMASDGAAMIVWVDLRHGTGQIYGRHLDSDGTPSGDPFIVSSLTSDLDNDDVSIDVDGSGKFTAFWLDRSGPTAVAAQYSNEGSFQNRFTFTGDVSGREMTDIAAAVGVPGYVYLLWEGLALDRRLYLTIFSSGGAIKVPTFEITNSASASSTDPDIYVDDEGFIICTWVDSGTGRRLPYRQIFDFNLHPAGNNSPVTLETVEFAVDPAATARNRMAWFAWSDPRAEGLNIYTSQLSYTPVGIDDDNADLLPVEFDLRQNYPNPFNPSTTIEFSVPVRSTVAVTICNILGETVVELINGIYEAGNYSVIWDGTDARGRMAASGIYLYRVTTGSSTLAKKMLLIK